MESVGSGQERIPEGLPARLGFPPTREHVHRITDADRALRRSTAAKTKTGGKTEVVSAHLRMRTSQRMRVGPSTVLPARNNAERQASAPRPRPRYHISQDTESKASVYKI